MRGSKPQEPGQLEGARSIRGWLFLLFKVAQDVLKDIIGSCKNIRVPVPDNLVTARFKYAATGCILTHVQCMLTTIKLNNQLGIQTRKIGNVPVDWYLSAKFPSVELTIAKPVPEATFGIC